MVFTITNHRHRYYYWYYYLYYCQCLEEMDFIRRRIIMIMCKYVSGIRICLKNHRTQELSNSPQKHSLKPFRMLNNKASAPTDCHTISINAPLTQSFQVETRNSPYILKTSILHLKIEVTSQSCVRKRAKKIQRSLQ
jgi:hypothetical protein